MGGSGFGVLFRLSTFGESHGPMIGGVLDGCPAGLPLSEEDIQPDLDRRRPGQSAFTTQRQEADAVRIVSGVFEGKTTGTPIGLLIENADQRSRDYGDIKDKFRPGHADVTYHNKYGFRDYRGGGRSSARETAIRVAGGAIAKKLLAEREGIRIRAALTGMGPLKVDPARWDWDAVENNPFFTPDEALVPEMAALIEQLRRDGDSVGALVEARAENVPFGLGEPVFDRLDADLAKALMSINAVKGVEVGAGMRAAELKGSENADEMRPEEAGEGVDFLSNNAGGILGGISSSQEIVLRMAVKPTSSIRIPKQSVDLHGHPVEVVTHGRHDPCVGIRAVPIAEAMAALVLADHWLRFQAVR